MKSEKGAHHSSSSRGSPQPIQGDTVKAGHSTTRICRTASGPSTSPVLHHPSPDLPPVNHYRITIRSTDEQNCISWNPGTQQAYNHSARPVKQPPSVSGPSLITPPLHLVHQLTSIGLHGKEGDDQQHRQTNQRALLTAPHAPTPAPFSPLFQHPLSLSITPAPLHQRQLPDTVQE